MLTSLFNKWTSRRKPIAGSCLWIPSISLCLFIGLWDSFAFKGYHWESLGIMIFFFFWLMVWLGHWYSSSPLPVIIPNFHYWTCLILSRLLSVYLFISQDASLCPHEREHMQFSLRHFCSAGLHFMNWLNLGLPLNDLSSSPTVNAYFAGPSNLDRQLLSGLELLSVHSFPTFTVANERIDITLMLLHLHITLCVFL